MNFYIGNSINEIKIEDSNIALNDELLEYLNSIEKQIPFTAFYNIDPYDDVEIEKESISNIINLCKYVFQMDLLKNYEDKTDVETLNSLIETGKRAIKEEKKLISIGD